MEAPSQILPPGLAPVTETSAMMVGMAGRCPVTSLESIRLSLCGFGAIARDVTPAQDRQS
jgi:hypothetical protein